MYNYFPGLIWQINTVLLIVTIFLSAGIVIYAGVRNFFIKIRAGNLIKIRENLRSLAFSGKETVAQTCPPLLKNVSVEQFFNILKQRQEILPKGFEKELRDCFIASGKISEIEKFARSAHNKWRKIQAIICLGYTGSASATEILKKTLQDRDEDISYYSMLALAEIKSRPSAKILLDFLEKNPFRSYKIISLFQQFPSKIIDEVIRPSGSKNADLRLWLAKIKKTNNE